MSLLQRMLTGYIPASQLPSFDNTWPWANLAGGNQIYPLGQGGTAVFKQEHITGSFQGIVQGAYQRNGVVFAVELTRLMLFAEARFQFQHLVKGRPGEYWSDQRLASLEHPWRGATTGDLLSRMLQQADFAGDAFPVRKGNAIRLLRPDWVTMMLGSDTDPTVDGTDPFAEIIGLLYHPGGRLDAKPEVYLPGEFGHFAPVPDPLGFQRGMPWIQPVITEIMGDEAASTHKLKFFENGATVNLVVDMDPTLTRDKYLDWVRLFEDAHNGVAQAYKTLYMAGGAKATPVGSSMQQMDFSNMQGRAEVRICIAGGVPATIVGVSEGLQGSSLNAGNFASAMRHFADITMRPLWRNAAGSFESIVPVPTGNRLWYDDRDIAALKDDILAAADVRSKDSDSVFKFISAGFKADAVIDAVTSGDISRLKGQHSGLFSVQLQAPGSTKMPAGEVPGESPVGEGTKPEVIPAGDESTKPVTGGSTKPSNGKTPAKILTPLTKVKP